VLEFAFAMKIVDDSRSQPPYHRSEIENRKMCGVPPYAIGPSRHECGCLWWSSLFDHCTMRPTKMTFRRRPSTAIYSTISTYDIETPYGLFKMNFCANTYVQRRGYDDRRRQQAAEQQAHDRR